MRARLVVALVLALTASSTSFAANGPDDLGITLLPTSSRIEPHRFSSGRDWEATVKFFKEKFRGLKNVRTYREVSLPNVKYVHYENTNPTSAWTGINVYQLKNGQVRIYLLPREKAASSTTAAPAPAKK